MHLEVLHHFSAHAVDYVVVAGSFYALIHKKEYSWIVQITLWLMAMATLTYGHVPTVINDVFYDISFMVITWVLVIKGKECNTDPRRRRKDDHIQEVS